MRVYKDKTLGVLIAQCGSILLHQSNKLMNKILTSRYGLANLLYPVIRVNVGGGDVIKFKALSRATAIRANGMLQKEPATTAWIKSFDENAVFWDIGANVGIYSLLAGKVRGAQVLAFEPYPPNFDNLIKNISLNNLSEMVSTFCVAFAQKTGVDGFYVNAQWQGAGASGNAFGAAVDQRGNSFQVANKISTLGITIDQFIETFDVPCPQYLKIDVDGIELDILKGATITLSNPTLKSVVVELEESRETETSAAVLLMTTAGFRIESTHRTTVNADNLSTNYHFVRG